MSKKVDVATEAMNLAETIVGLLDKDGVREEGITILACATELLLATPFNDGNYQGYDEMSGYYKEELDAAHHQVKDAMRKLLQQYN